MYLAYATRRVSPKERAIYEAEDECENKDDADKSCNKWREDETDRRFPKEVTLDLWDEGERVHDFSEIEVLSFTDRQKIFAVIGAT